MPECGSFSHLDLAQAIKELWRLRRGNSTILKSTYYYAKDEEIYRYGEAATFCYQVISGPDYEKAQRRTSPGWRILFCW